MGEVDHLIGPKGKKEKTVCICRNLLVSRQTLSRALDFFAGLNLASFQRLEEKRSEMGALNHFPTTHQFLVSHSTNSTKVNRHHREAYSRPKMLHR